MDDVSVFYASSVSSPLQFGLRFAAESTGLLSLSQRVVLRLLTPKGNATGQPDFGSDLLPSIRSGQYRNAGAIERLFAVVRLDLLQQSAADELGSETVLRDIQLSEVSVIGDTVRLSIAVLSGTGEQAVFNVTV